MLPVQFNKDRAKPRVRDRHRYNRQTQGQTQAQIQTHTTDSQETGDTGSMRWRIQVWIHTWLNDSNVGCFSFLSFLSFLSSVYRWGLRDEPSPQGLLSVPFSTTLKRLPKDSTTHSGQDSLTSIS